MRVAARRARHDPARSARRPIPQAAKDSEMWRECLFDRAARAFTARTRAAASGAVAVARTQNRARQSNFSAKNGRRFHSPCACMRREFAVEAANRLIFARLRAGRACVSTGRSRSAGWLFRRSPSSPDRRTNRAFRASSWPVRPCRRWPRSQLRPPLRSRRRR